MTRTWSSFPAFPAVLLFAAAAVALYLRKKKSDSSGSSSLASSSSPDSASSSTDGDDDGVGASEPLPAAAYEVFLSFRGTDVRTVFADFLYGYLDHSNIRTFLDDEELVRGEEIEESLYKAIEDSKVYIPIFSPDYASSKWCLRELSHMVKCWKEGKGNIILPIFYMMEPRDVRHHSDSYSEAFVQHSKRYNAETIKEWKEALATVGKLKGWHVTKSNRQGVIVREVFSRVRSHLMRSYLLVTEQLVNINPHVDQVTNLMNKGVKVVGIIGMGGLGKSTIAMAVRDKVYTEFDYCCFLRDVRQTLTESGGIMALQKQIISAIPGYDGNVQNPSQGIRLITDRVCKEKCLIIIDDVDETFVFEQVLGKLADFSLESRFIITTRNRGVLEVFQHEVYEPEGLDHDHSLQLFSRHAFELDYPPEDFVALSEEFIEVAAHLPLALKVIGSTLHRKTERFWKEKLVQLKDHMAPDMVRKTLMISYSDLTSEEQHIFLDIASVFIGGSKELPFYMWSDCGFYPEIGIDALILKSLIKVTEENSFWMHDSIRDLGRTIIYEEDRQCPWKRSRIWSNKDAMNILTKGESSFKLCWLALDNCSLTHVNMNMEKSIVFYQRTSEDSNAGDDSSGWENLKVAHNLKAIDLWNCNGLGNASSLSRYEAPVEDLFNLDQALVDLMDRLELNSDGVKAIVITGMDGIGKTTISRELYHKVGRKFDGCCFAEVAQKTFSKTDGIVSLQRKIIHSILQSHDCKVEDVNEGINIIKTRICKMKVLIVLDVMDATFQFENVFGKPADFCSGSRFIITTRDERIAKCAMSLFQGCLLYEQQKMDVHGSLILFGRHAFGAGYHPQEFLALSMEFVKVAGGHPLSLKVIGSLLFHRDTRFWEHTLAQINCIPDFNVRDIMMFCYNELSDEEQQIFLDIACFFNGVDKAQPSLMWDSCGRHPESAIATLIQRSLIGINQSDKSEEFWMHSILRDLGASIVHQEDCTSPWRRSRIWSNKDALDMLTHEMGTDRVEGLKVEAEDNILKLTDRQFDKLSGLLYLDVDGGEFDEGNFGNYLPNIRWLKMRNCSSNPISCDMKKLVILHIQGSSVGDDWRGWQNLKMARNLKTICLHQCNRLERVVDLSECENLESVDIQQCAKMSGELQISHLKHLKVLKIVDTNITKITGDIGMLRNLQEITLPRRLVYFT